MHGIAKQDQFPVRIRRLHQEANDPQVAVILLDVVLVHKLGAPGHPELAIGAVDETGQVYLGPYVQRLKISTDYLAAETAAQKRGWKLLKLEIRSAGDIEPAVLGDPSRAWP